MERIGRGGKRQQQGDISTADVLVVGGGMTGLATALALHHRGVGVRVLERAARRRRRGGAALSVDPGLLERVTGLDAGDLPLARDSYYDFAAWGDLHAWLKTRVRQARIPLERGREVVAVSVGDAPRVALADGGTRRGALVVGADGVRSALRRAVEPDRPAAEYAGYLVWRGLVPEADLPPGTPLPAAGNTFDVLYASGFALGAYAVPGPDGSTVPGRRRLAFAWCDARRHEALADFIGRDEGRFDTIGPEAIDDGLLRGLAATAREVWPGPWDVAIAHAAEKREIFATPIAEHLPRRLVSGAVALVGDAAHATTPMTGAGLDAGLRDALALGGAVGRHGPSPRALAAYEAERLGPDRRLVSTGRRMGRSFLESAIWQAG